MLIFTLSSIPPRFADIGQTLQSLLAQSAKADRIILYIPYSYKRFSDWDGALPKVPDGVEIVRVAQDLGPATKILPAILTFQGLDCDILFFDDDRHYTPGWAATLLTESRVRPGCCIATRGLMAHSLVGSRPERARQPIAKVRQEWSDWRFRFRRIWLRRRHGAQWLYQPDSQRRRFGSSGYIDIFEGCGGVLVRPEYFDATVFEIPNVAWAVDDIWLSAMLAKNNVPVWLVANTVSPSNTIAQISAPLAKANIGGASRDQANKSAVQYVQQKYSVWT